MLAYYISLYCNVSMLYVVILWCQHVTQTGAAAEPERDTEVCEYSSGQMKQRLHFSPKIHGLRRRVIRVELQLHTKRLFKVFFSIKFKQISTCDKTIWTQGPLVSFLNHLMVFIMGLKAPVKSSTWMLSEYYFV